MRPIPMTSVIDTIKLLYENIVPLDWFIPQLIKYSTPEGPYSIHRECGNSMGRSLFFHFGKTGNGEKGIPIPVDIHSSLLVFLEIRLKNKNKNGSFLPH